MQVTLNMAEMDAVYSQYAFVQVLAFLDQASPPPNLDPLMVRATVTQHEIVRERLMSPKRSSQLLMSQQFQSNVEVPLFPCILKRHQHTSSVLSQLKIAYALIHWPLNDAVLEGPECQQYTVPV